MLLKRKLGIQNIIECYDSREVMRLLAEHAVDLVLLDYSMPYLDGEEVLAQIQRKYANMLNVIVLSGQEHRHKEKNCTDLGNCPQQGRRHGVDTRHRGKCNGRRSTLAGCQKIVIIGGGGAGLATGVYGQLKGYETEIIEMHTVPGGQCKLSTDVEIG